MTDHAAIKVVIRKPDGEVETRDIIPGAAIEALPFYVFEFPFLAGRLITFRIGGPDDGDLIIVLPDGAGEITLVGFLNLLGHQHEASIRWGDGGQTASLDDVFVKLTGRQLDGDEKAE